MQAMPTNSDEYLDECAKVYTGLLKWFRGKPGTSVLRSEKYRLSQILPNLFGYHIIHLGNPSADNILNSSRINHKIITQVTTSSDTDDPPSLFCSCSAVPVAADSMDVVVLQHILEFENNPHQVLRETERVLIGEGHVVIIAFNPWSLWGLWRFFLAWRDQAPWNGKYISMNRLKDWLLLLDFEIMKTDYFYFRPPLRNVNFMQRLMFLEQLGKYCWPWFGSIYMLVAKKRVIPLTPVKMQWQARRRLLNSEVTEPSARVR